MLGAGLFGILGHRWAFERVRPFVVGGIDMAPAYRELAADAHSVVLDIGCGMGDALNHLDAYTAYLGLDTDARAIDTARARHGGRPNTRFEARAVSSADLFEYRPTHVVMVGLLHHLPDDEALGLLERLRGTESIESMVTLDIVFLAGRRYNNLLARLDRGRHCRTMSGYLELVRRAGLALESQRAVPSHPTRGRVEYFVMKLSRSRQKPESSL
jgi:SAM-dependent methyltransferase